RSVGIEAGSTRRGIGKVSTGPVARPGNRGGKGCGFSAAASNHGTGPGSPNFSAGFSLRIGWIFSIRSGSSAQVGSFHHHHGHQPQHQRNFIAKWPLASVMATGPTGEIDDHHQKKSTSKARTCAPGTGLPSAQTTRPSTTKVRHHRNHVTHHAGVTMKGASWRVFFPNHWLGETFKVRVWKLKISSSETLSGPMATVRG